MERSLRPTRAWRLSGLLGLVVACLVSSPVVADEVGKKLVEKPPLVAGNEVLITAEVKGDDLNGVVLSHGGRRFGYCLWFDHGKPRFSVRNHQKLTELTVDEVYTGTVTLKAHLTNGKMSLSVNGAAAVERSPGVLLADEPAAGLTVGFAKGLSVGSHETPFKFQGEIVAVDVQTKPGRVARVMPPLDPNVKRPNIVVFLSDDHTCRDSSLYGSPDVKTSNMERLAAAGMTFDRAYVNSPSCGPSRAAFLSGLYPARTGAEPNHQRVKEGTKSLPTCFFDLGYEVVSFGKVGHYGQTPEWGFDIARHYNYHEDIAIEKAIEWLEARQSERPLLLFVGTNWPHVPWPKKSESFDPTQVVVPPNHVDNETTRERRGQYYSAVANMDHDLGAVYDAVRGKLGEGTFILHTSDHGAQWPFGKWNLYEDGIRTPLVVSWPGKIAAGVRTNAMVQWFDILPTLIDVAGGTPPADIDGKSFLPVLLGKTTAHREEIFTTHSGDGNNNVYPIRAVTTDDGWKYIRNIHPEYLYTSHVTTKQADTGYWSSWEETAKISPAAAAIVKRYQQRPAEELYRIGNDPYELTNLVNDPQLASKVKELRSKLDRWIAQTQDQLQTFGEPKLITP